MDLRALRALVTKINFATHGVPATVTPPDEFPIGTRVIWLTPEPALVPGGLEFQRLDPKRSLAVPRVDVPSLPRGSIIVIPEADGLNATEWRVDSIDRMDGEHVRCVVMPNG